MHSFLTTEYRCRCGRLLFKGLVLQDLIEVKCHRCKRMHYFPGLKVGDSSRRFAVLTDTNGVIVNASASIVDHLQTPIHRAVQTDVAALFARKRDIVTDTALAKQSLGHPYLRFDTTLLTREGETVAVTVSYRTVRIDDRRFILRVVDELRTVHDEELQEIGFDVLDICDLVVETNGRGIILYANNQTEKILGFRPEEVVAQKVSDIEAPEERERRDRNRKLLGDRQATFRSKNFVVISKQGKRVAFDVHSTPFYDHSGEFIGYRNMLWLVDKAS